MIAIAEDDNLRKRYIQLTQNGHYIEVQSKQSLPKVEHILINDVIFLSILLIMSYIYPN